MDQPQLNSRQIEMLQQRIIDLLLDKIITGLNACLAEELAAEPPKWVWEFPFYEHTHLENDLSLSVHSAEHLEPFDLY